MTTKDELIRTKEPSDPKMFTTELQISNLFETEYSKDASERHLHPLADIENICNGAQPIAWCCVRDTEWHKSHQEVCETHPYAVMVETGNVKGWITTCLSHARKHGGPIGQT